MNAAVNSLLPAGCRVWPRCPLKQQESYIRRNQGMGPGCCPLGYTEHWLPGQWPDCTRWSKSHPVREGKRAETPKWCFQVNFALSFTFSVCNWADCNLNIGWNYGGRGHLCCQWSLRGAVKVGHGLAALRVTCRRTRRNSKCVTK